MPEVEIRIARFSPTPGGRYRRDYEKSGEEFYEEVLLPRLQAGDSVALHLDGVVAFPSSFLDEIFTRAVKDFGSAVKGRLSFVSTESPSRVGDAIYYLDRAIKNYGH